MNHEGGATELGRRTITVPGTVGRYHLVAKLGSGGMASAYLAVMRARGNFQKLVVLKIPHDRVARDPSLRPMFLDEARLAARLSHPNVVQTYEVLDDADRTILVMEYLEGKSLGEILRQERKGEEADGPPGLARTMRLRAITDALSGLHYAHEAADFDGRPLGMVHRDVSPQNLIVTYDGQVKLLDFGIAKAATSSHVTLTGTFKGKLRYMAPEQVHRRALDRRADVFGMGAVLFEATAGRPLWESVSDVDVVGALLRGEVPVPRDAPAGLDPALHAIVQRALAPDPDDRYPTALELQADLESYLETLERVSGKQLGSYVARLFSAQRSRTSRAIQEQITRSMLSAPSDDAGDRLATNLPLALPDRGRAVPSLAPATVDRPAVSSPPTRALAWMGFGAAATVGVAAIIFAAGGLRTSASASASTSASSEQAAIAPAAPPPPAAPLPPPPPAVLSQAGPPRPRVSPPSTNPESRAFARSQAAPELSSPPPGEPATSVRPAASEPDLGY